MSQGNSHSARVSLPVAATAVSTAKPQAARRSEPQRQPQASLLKYDSAEKRLIGRGTDRPRKKELAIQYSRTKVSRPMVDTGGASAPFRIVRVSPGRLNAWLTAGAVTAGGEATKPVR